VKIAATPQELHAARIGLGDAGLVVGCDLVVTASADAVSRMSVPATRAVVNATTAPTAEFVKNPNWQLPGSDLTHDIASSCGAAEFLPAAELATALMGDSIATNMFMLGYALQKGWVPLAAASIERAIELNGVSVDFNRKSFVWGRRAALDLDAVRRAAAPADVVAIAPPISRTLDEMLERRVKLLTDYQNAAYAERYRTLVERVRNIEKDKTGGDELARAVARYYAKLLAYKDEYEVARLYTTGEFAQKIAAMFEGNYKLVFHLAPPVLAKPDPVSGVPRKMRFGAWMMPAFSLLAKLKGLRGGMLDVFGRSAERRMERALIVEYEHSVEQLLAGLDASNHALAVEIASLPETIRGYGHVKERHVAETRKRGASLLARFEGRSEATLTSLARAA